MDTKLSNRLFKKYKFLRKKEMPNGFMCGDGWFKIIDGMCKELSSAYLLPDVFVITKVYDKHGNMAVHSRGGNNVTRMIIEDTCELTEEICDACGNQKDLEQCPKCTVPVIIYATDEEEKQDGGV